MTSPLDVLQMLRTPRLAELVRVQLTAHKAVAAFLSALVTLAGDLVAAGTLHGKALVVAQALIAVFGLLGITGAVYQTRAKVTAVDVAPVAVHDDVDLDHLADDDDADDLDRLVDELDSGRREVVAETELVPQHAEKLAGAVHPRPGSAPAPRP